MIIKRNISLKNYSTFNVSSKAGIIALIEDIADVSELPDLLSNNSSHLILGDGSNILFAGDVIDHLILKNDIKGIKVSHKSKSEVLITVGGGENWHQLVAWTVDNSFFGLENLALIPGTVGAAPVQNIGAYGVEQEERFVRLTAYDTENYEIVTFEKGECDFSYRNSLFKNKKGRYLILNVTYQLNKEIFSPKISYKAISDYFAEHPEFETSKQRNVFNAVIAIRSSKLPDPKEIGNAGSFFKNPIIPKSRFQELAKEYEEMPFYPMDDKMVKIPAAWLIDQCGWKGYRDGDAGVYPKQALVLVNYGDATGEKICALAKKIQQSVQEQFNITITPEVNIIQ